MKISRQLPVDNEYGACADMRRQGVTCRQENSFKKILVGRYVLLHKTKPSTCEDKVRLFYAIKKENTVNAIVQIQVTTDLRNSENLKTAIAQLCHDLQVCNFTML